MSDKRDIAATVWDFADPNPKEIQAAHARKKRVTGLVRALVGGLIGVAIFFWWNEILSYVVWGISGITGLLAVLSPTKGYGYVERGVAGLAWAIGSLFGLILLPVLYFSFFVPFGLLFRRGKKNVIKGAFPQDVTTFWVSRDSSDPKPSDYERQF